jgi:hypothetical protein
MSAAEALPWKLSLKWLKHLTDNPSDDLVAAAADEIMCICEKQQDSTASVSQPTCKKLVDELKVCWHKQIWVVLYCLLGLCHWVAAAYCQTTSSSLHVPFPTVVVHEPGWPLTRYKL